MDPGQRLDELESRYTELERLVHELNDVIYAQQRQLDGLTQAHQQLKSRVEADPGVVDASAQERPPHY